MKSCLLVGVLFITALFSSIVSAETLTKVVSSKLRCYCEQSLSADKYILPKQAAKKLKGAEIKRATKMTLIHVDPGVAPEASEACASSLDDGTYPCWTMHSSIEPKYVPKTHANSDIDNATCKEQGVQMGAGSC